MQETDPSTLTNSISRPSQAGKSITKLVVPESPEANSRLFKLVAWLTGSKNGIKGIGYFLGAALITFATFVVSLVVLEIALFFVTIPACFWLDRDLGVSNSKKKLTLKSILNKGYDVNVLSCARLFLFGARDVCTFVFPLLVMFHVLVATHSFAKCMRSLLSGSTSCGSRSRCRCFSAVSLDGIIFPPEAFWFVFPSILHETFRPTHPPCLPS